jgi:hypothetical protein
MIGELQILRQGFEKAAAIPEEKPKWGTPPETDLPGEANPAGLDENRPVGDDAQHTRHLMANFNTAPATQARNAKDLGGKFDHFTDGNRVTGTQLNKTFPKSNDRVYQAMAQKLRQRLKVGA